MGKGSKQRPTDHAQFSANFDAIFNKPVVDEQEEEEDLFDYDCERCGGIDKHDVYAEREVNMESYGDQRVERVEIYLSCTKCGGSVDEK